MSLAYLALCFACAVVGGVVGLSLFFALVKVKVTAQLDVTFKKNPVCPSCRESLEPFVFTEDVRARSDEFSARGRL